MGKRRVQVGTVVLTALIAGGIAVPVQAEAPPGASIKAVPDSGSRPATFGDIPLLPSGAHAMPPTLPTTEVDMLRAQVDAATVEAQVLSEQINKLLEEQEVARLTLAWAQHQWGLTDTALKAAQEEAAKTAADVYASANQLPPGFQNGSTLRDLELLQPPGTIPGSRIDESPAWRLERATAAEKAAAEALAAAEKASQTIANNIVVTEMEYKQRDKARLLLQDRFLSLLTDEEREKELEAAKLGKNYSAGKSNHGLRAHANAQKVIAYALRQLGKEYRFAEEGPTYFDCSGLTIAGYGTVGYQLPRVSWDQYNATSTKPVALDALLPGDLLFFARDKSDWRTIHHVMIYLGDGKIIHAPRSGDVVKIANINLGPGSPVDFATRVYDGQPVTTATSVL